jgi:hypothetical protein
MLFEGILAGDLTIHMKTQPIKTDVMGRTQKIAAEGHSRFTWYETDITFLVGPKGGLLIEMGPSFKHLSKKLGAKPHTAAFHFAIHFSTIFISFQLGHD